MGSIGEVYFMSYMKLLAFELHLKKYLVMSLKENVVTGSAVIVTSVIVAVFNARLHVMQCTVLRRPFCPSVKCVYCDKTKNTSAHIFIPHERSFILVFRHEGQLWGRPHLPKILGRTDPVQAKMPIFYPYSLVAPLCYQ